MAYLERPYILYSIRANIFKQSMKKANLLTVWKETKDFLKLFTNVDYQNPSFIKLKIFPIFNRKHFDNTLDEILLKSERPTLEPIWNIRNDDLENVILSLEKVQLFMPSKPNAIELSLWYSFKLVEPVSKIELPNQECNSSINFIFSKSHSCMPSLVFPFLEPTIEFWNLLDFVKPHLPFNLDENLLRLVRVKDGRPSSFKKIERL